MVVLEHGLVFLKVLLAGVIEDVPLEVRTKMAKQKNDENQIKLRERLMMYNYITQTEFQALSTTKPPSSERDLAANTIASQYLSQFGYNPLFLLGIIVLPWFFQKISISVYFYIPASLAVCSYLKVQKDRRDRKAAAGIVSDENVRVISAYVNIQLVIFVLGYIIIIH